MRSKYRAILSVALPLLAFSALFGVRFIGAYSHQLLAVLVTLGLLRVAFWRGGLAWKGRWRKGIARGFRVGGDHRRFIEAACRASFWAMAGIACLWVFPRSADTAPLAVVVGVLAALRVAATFTTPRRAFGPRTFLMAAGAMVMAFDLGRAFLRGPSAVSIAPPFAGEWLVVQGGRSPLQNHHLVAYNQRFAIDLVRLENGRIFDAASRAQGNLGVHGWEQPVLSPADGRIAFAHDGMVDGQGDQSVDRSEGAAGNTIVIELENGYFVVLAHLRQGTVRVAAGDTVRKGEPLALVGNSGNTTLPHLHLQVQTHADLWHPENRSVPFAFEPGGRIPIRNDLISADVLPTARLRHGRADANIMTDS